jgi:hypothetical protein
MIVSVSSESEERHLGAVVILRVVDEDPVGRLHISRLQIVDDPEAVVEEALVIEVEVVALGQALVIV